jgi:FkbH-like protein
MLDITNIINEVYENSVSYDFIIIHSDISQLLYTNDQKIVKEQFFNLFKKLTDNNKTLIVPTFNWDFCGGKEYHYLNTSSKVGILSKWCLESDIFERTNDPVYSCAISGINKNIFLDCEYTTAFGKNSIFDKVNCLNSLVIMINNEHLTVVHYYEQKKESNYRYSKKFNGSVTYKKNNKKNTIYELFVRSYETNEINNNCFSKYKNYKSIIKNTYYDNFYINFINLNIFSKEILNSISNDKYFLVKNKVEVSYNLNYSDHTKQFVDSDMVTFAKISGDYNPLHYDKEFSKNLIFQDWILHGMNCVLFSLNNLSQNIDIKEFIYIKKINIIYHNPIFIGKKISFKYFFTGNKIEIKILGEDILLTLIHLEYKLINNLLSIDKDFDDTFNFKEPENIFSKDFKNYNKKTKIKANINLIKSYYPNLLKNFNYYQIIVLITISRNIGMVFPGLNSICMKINIDFYENYIIKDINFKYNNYFNNILIIDLSSDCIKGNIYVNTNRYNLNTIYLLSYKNIDFVNKELENNFKKGYKILSCEYNQLEQDIINKESELYKNDPKFIFVINKIEDILKTEFIDIYDKNFDIIFDNYINLIRNLRKNINSVIYINSFHHTTIPITQNAFNNFSLDFLINSYNEKLYKLSDELTDINIINSNLFSNYNKIDFKSYFVGNYNYSYEYSKKLADFMYGLIMNKLGNSIRLIVIDLDNTLWGGVVGEDGVNGIKIGETYPGNCFTYFQKVLKSFTKIGISLALCSKNDEKIAKQVFDERHEMILKYDDFISKKINWNNKSENILNISKEVGLGLKNILFIDDNPIEREEVKQILPDINILEIDVDSPENYASLLLSNKKLVFNKILKEDLKRNFKYKKNIEFTNLKVNSSNMQEFYKSLNSKVYLNKLSDKNIDRCESLINKTNQFNFTTIRLNKNQIIEMNETNYDFYVIGYENNFFEYENVGVIIFDNNQSEIEIYNYLLSCRVIGKGVEEDILIYFINNLKSEGFQKITGKIIPTDRNIPVREIYSKLGFIDNGDNNYYLNITKFNKNTTNCQITKDKELINRVDKIEEKEIKHNLKNTKNEEIKKKIYSILDEITEDIPTVDTLIIDYQDWDSLKTILFIKKIENKFDLSISGDYFNLSIKDILNLINENKNIKKI